MDANKNPYGDDFLFDLSRSLNFAGYTADRIEFVLRAVKYHNASQAAINKLTSSLVDCQDRIMMLVETLNATLATISGDPKFLTLFKQVDSAIKEIRRETK